MTSNHLTKLYLYWNWYNDTFCYGYQSEYVIQLPEGSYENDDIILFLKEDINGKIKQQVLHWI